MCAQCKHLVAYQGTSIDSRVVERGSISLKLRLSRPATSEARLLPGSLVLWLESGKVVLAAVRDRGDTELLGISLLTDPGRPVPCRQITLYEYTVYYEAYRHSLAALQSPTSVPLAPYLAGTELAVESSVLFKTSHLDLSPLHRPLPQNPPSACE